MYSNTLTRVKNLAKRLYYHNKITEHKNNPKKTWDVLRSLLPSKTKSNTPNSLTVKSSTITDINEIAEEFNYHFATIGKSLASSINNNDKSPTFYLKNPCTNSIYLQPTSTHEVMALINLLNLNKANGHDDIDPYFLKIASPIIAFPLSLFFNHSISLGIFPNKLKLAKVIPVYKKGSADQLNNYRPISLLPSLSKIFERLLHKRMLSFFNCNNILVPTQYGFRHKRCTIHPILDLITSCHDNIQNKDISALLFLDIQKAFDSVSHSILLRKLEHYGIRGIANSLMKTYLEKRKQYVSIAAHNSTDRTIEFGVPQGSILGPLLFLIYINDLPLCLHTIPRFYADDTALFISGKSLSDIQTLANLELFNVSQWMQANSLVVNTAKTVALIITPQLHHSIPSANDKSSINFTFNNQIVQPSTSAKYLGITIDNKLLFKQHIILLENRVARSVGIIAKVSYYLPFNTLITLYHALVHSQLLYALPIWASTYKTYLDKLEKLQNKALRIIFKTPLRDPITPLYCRSGILKLNDLFYFEVAKLMHQIIHKKSPNNFESYFTYSSNISAYSTRQKSANHLFLPRFHTSRTQRSIKYLGSKIWNSIPYDIRILPFTKFKSSYKFHLLSKYV